MRILYYALLAACFVHSCALVLNRTVADHNFAAAVHVRGNSSKFNIDIYGVEPLQSDVLESVQMAFKILSNVWPSSVPVTTRITFTDLGSPETLASGGGVLFVLFDRSPDKELLPVAAAEALTSRDLNFKQEGLDRYDVLIKVNLRTSWHLDIRSSPGRHEYDLVTVLLHEAYHNLLFSGAISVRAGEDGKLPTGSLVDGHPSRFDLFLANEKGCAVLSYLKDKKLASRMNISTAELLAQSVMNDRLFFEDHTTGITIPLYSPRKYNSKSSVYHVDTSRGAEKSFMNRFVSSGFVHREVNEEIRRIQNALLRPLNRGARHCPFPLSNPFQDGSKTASSSSFGHLSTFEGSKTWGVRGWALILLSIIAATGSIAFLLCCSSAISRNLRSLRNGVMRVKRIERKMSTLSTSSNNIFIDDGMSAGDISIDTRDIDVDMDDLLTYEYCFEERLTGDSIAL